MTSALFTTAVAIGNATGASNKREIVDNLPISFDVEVKKRQTFTTWINTFSDNTFLQNHVWSCSNQNVINHLETSDGNRRLFVVNLSQPLPFLYVDLIPHLPSYLVNQIKKNLFRHTEQPWDAGCQTSVLRYKRH